MATQVLIEQIDLTEGTLDREARTVEQVIIVPGWSQNGRYYSENVLAQASNLFEGAKTFGDHPGPNERREMPGRSVRNITGWLSGVRVNGGRIMATRHFARTQAGEDSFALVADIIDGNAPKSLMGASINAIGKVAKGEAPDGKEGLMVEAITAVHSVDDVTTPAAGGGFDPLLAGGDELTASLLAALSEDEWRAARPDLVERLKKEWQVVRQDQAVTAAHAERDQARDALVEAQHELMALKDTQQALEADMARLRAEVVRKGLEVQLELALREAKLPTEWEKQLREQLGKAEPGDWLGIVASERKKAQSGGGKQPVTVQGAPQRTPAPQHARIVERGPVYLPPDATPDDLQRLLARRQ
jgi:two-component sensor histidine kinase